MATPNPATECPPERMSELIATATRDEREGLALLDGLLDAYAGDARLHFLRGSLLAAVRDYGEARLAMQQAVAVAPGYALARFQLGLLELSSGEPAAAIETWRPLEALPAEHPLRLFARGLNHMIVDDFGPAIELLERGMTGNDEIPALNRDMQLLVDGMREKAGGGAAEPVSSAHLLLQQYAHRPGKPGEGPH